MNNGVSNIAHAQNNFYDRVMLMRAVPAFIHTRYAQVRDIPTGNTNIVKFRRYTNLVAATTPLVSGITPLGSQLAVTDITATVAQYGDYVTVDDFFQLTTLDPVLTETAELLGDQAGDTLDQITRDILVAGTNVLYASTATQRTDITASMKLTAAEVKNAVRILKNNKARRITSMINPTTGINTTPINASYIGFVHPDTTRDLKDVSDFVPVNKYPNQTSVMPDEVGAIDEVRFIETPNAKEYVDGGSSNADVYATVIVGQNAYGISRIAGNAMRNIIKPLGSAGSADPLDQRATSGWKATFTAVRLNESFMIRVEHGTSSS